MPAYPTIDPNLRRDRLHHPGRPVRMVLDTDTYNEIDDQFAVVYSLLSPEHLTVEAIYAAPFHNARSAGPGDGMEKSYEEILRLLERLRISPDGLVHRGSIRYLKDLDDPEHPPANDAVTDLIHRAMDSPPEDPLYVVAIGAITNIAAAIILEPRIIERIVVLWLGGQPIHFPYADEFNLSQDYPASRLIFDCGAPLIHIPCFGVASHLLTCLPELREHLGGHGPIAEYLIQIFDNFADDHFAHTKEIWDLGPIGWLLFPEEVPTDILPSPILSEDFRWHPATETGRHPIATARVIHRNKIFADLFRKIRQFRD